MASPQIENGYTMLSNELLEAYAMIRISGEENQLFWFIVRKTYGFKKKDDAISLSQFALATGINKQNVCRALSKLITKNMIIKNDNGLITRYRIQKDYTSWKPLSKKIILSKLITPIIKKDNQTPEIIIKKDTYKRNKNTKETITKEIHDKIRHDVISYLNEKAGKDFDPDSRQSIEFINGRLNDKKPATLDDFKRVIDIKCFQWLKNKEFNKNLRPSTLFRPSNFENYRNELPMKDIGRLGNGKSKGKYEDCVDEEVDS